MTITEKLVYNKRVKAFFIAIIIVVCLLTLRVSAADNVVSTFIKEMFDSCWGVIEGICKYAGLAFSFLVDISTVPGTVADGAKAIGITLTTMFFAMAVFSDLAMFKVERIEEAIRVGMKFVIAKIIIENTAGIMESIRYMFFTKLGGDNLITAFTWFGGRIGKLFETSTIEPGTFELNYILVILLFFIPTLFIVVFSIYSVFFTICGMLFEMGIHIAIAPIAFSTLVNEMTRPTGIAFIKSYSAVCLQMFVIAVITNLFSRITGEVQGIIDGMFASIIGGSIIFITEFYKSIVPMIMLLIFSAAVKKSGDITKRMLGA